MEDLKQEVEQYSALVQICKDMLEHKKRDTRLLFIALIASLLMNVLITAGFLWYESQWEFSDTVTTTTEQSVDGDGSDIVNGDQYNDKSQNKSGGEK